MSNSYLEKIRKAKNSSLIFFIISFSILIALTFSSFTQILFYYISDYLNVINITRYRDGKLDKGIRFFGTGGLGSLAHEYGHFLDYAVGSRLSQNNQF